MTPNLDDVHENLSARSGVHVYDDPDDIRSCAQVQSGPYALTGSIIAQDRAAIVEAMTELRPAAGNFTSMTSRPARCGTAAVWRGRVSGTNDKAGSILNLLRWPPHDQGDLRGGSRLPLSYMG